MTRSELARLIDHTLLKPDATEQDIRRLCQEAAEYGFASVCVHPVFVPLAAAILSGTEIRVGTVVGFPLGANFPEAKAYEARLAVERGAVEIDMVMNIGALKGGDHRRVVEDIRAVVESAGEGARVKVILETGLLTDEEKVAACELSREAGAHFVKTSTGFGYGGATEHDVALMRRTVGDAMGVKAAGGIRDAATALRLVAAGATRIGCSASVAVVQGLAD
ncbi:MAG: deoxyribose-phosphate aldolase [Firmicutes bacterium]|nr:deoxyribose-phosphate aldolase [Bacillota bacterium]MBO2521742.1 deoxyribose-phosphate aldolase [Bacillota bacterium]